MLTPVDAASSRSRGARLPAKPKPKRKGINPFTKEEQVFAAKPATMRIKARALKKRKGAAL